MNLPQGHERSLRITGHGFSEKPSVGKGGLGVFPRDGKPGSNQIPAQLVRSIEMPRTVRLEFAGGIQVELARPEFEKQKLNKEWLVWFPPDALRVI